MTRSCRFPGPTEILGGSKGRTVAAAGGVTYFHGAEPGRAVGRGRIRDRSVETAGLDPELGWAFAFRQSDGAMQEAFNGRAPGII